MKHKIIKSMLSMASIAFAFVLIAAPASAITDAELWGGKKDVVATNTGLGEKDPREIIASIINTVLGFLGIIAVIIILMGGFKWMTAMGNDDQVGEARTLIANGIIGLVIVLSAFGIASFVVSQLVDAT